MLSVRRQLIIFGSKFTDKTYFESVNCTYFGLFAHGFSSRSRQLNTEDIHKQISLGISVLSPQDYNTKLAAGSKLDKVTQTPD